MTAAPRTAESKHGTRLRTDAAIRAGSAGIDPKSWATSDFGLDLLRSRWDTAYFARELLGITLHPGQIDLATAILMRDESGWRPRYLDINCSAGNRAGKTLGLAIAIFHSTLFKLGIHPPDPTNEVDLARWSSLPYDWYHFAIAQETSELVFIELVRILQGVHEAQKAGCPLTKALGKGVATWDRKERGEYPWLRLHPVLGGGEIHFRTTGERAIGSLGKDMNGVSYDECAFDPHFEFIVHEVLHMRRLSTGGQLVLISTPTEGLTAFADRWYEGDPEAPDRDPNAISLRMSTRTNIGFGIEPAMFERLVAGVPESLVPQNIDGHFIEGSKAFFSSVAVDSSFVPDMPEVAAPEKGHRYIQGVDPALTFDSTWSIVLDHTGPVGIGVRAERQRGRTTGPVIAALATNAHNAYNTGASRCQTGIDATGFGGKMFRDLLSIHPLTSVEFGGTRGKKLKLLNDLKYALEKGMLRFPRSGPWLTLRRQLLGYRLDDKGLETDAVMALAVAVSLMRRTPGESAAVVPFDYFHPHSKRVSSGPAISGPRRVASSALMSDIARE